MALVFGKAVVDCFLGLVIQAIEILGLKLLEVLWDGVCKGEQAQEVRPTPAPRPPARIPVPLALGGCLQGSLWAHPARLPETQQSFFTSGCSGNCWLKAQELSFTGLKKISRQSGFLEFMILFELEENRVPVN